MAFPTPGSDAANRARWAALTPEQRAREQAYADTQAQAFRDKVARSQRIGNLVKWGVIGTVGAGAGIGATGAMGGAAGSAAGSGSAAGTAAATGGGMTGTTGLGIANLLAGVFTNLWGAKTAANSAKDATSAQERAILRAAELEKQALDEALAYQKEIDARDYGDWLVRENRDRADWEASEQRRAPYRALGDSAVRTLGDMTRTPWTKPAQEVPVPVWRNSGPPVAAGAASGPPTSNTMPVGGGGQVTPTGNPQALTQAYLAANPNAKPGSFKDFLTGYTPYMAERGYQVQFMEHPTKHDKVTITGPDGRRQVVDLVEGAGGPNPKWAYMVEGAGGGAATTSASASGGGWRNTSDPNGLLAKYGRARTFRDLVRA